MILVVEITYERLRMILEITYESYISSGDYV